ncbi:MAG: hypothetical protein LQ340_004609 [Diploschistes diacapsis]|nr:MAG: hypothetical protein LQ340_004609 [Diploschistes diacapsis]
MALLRLQSSASLAKAFTASSRGTRYFRTFSPFSAEATKDWDGKPAEEHVTNQNHEQDIFAAASNSGQRAKEEDDSHDGGHKHSQATAQTSTTTAKEAEAKSGRKDRGMGLQDERGGRGR